MKYVIFYDVHVVVILEETSLFPVLSVTFIFSFRSCGIGTNLFTSIIAIIIIGTHKKPRWAYDEKLHFKYIVNKTAALIKPIRVGLVFNYSENESYNRRALEAKKKFNKKRY